MIVIGQIVLWTDFKGSCVRNLRTNGGIGIKGKQWGVAGIIQAKAFLIKKKTEWNFNFMHLPLE